MRGDVHPIAGFKGRGGHEQQSRRYAVAEQIMAVDWSRLGEPIGHLSHRDMQAVDHAIREVLALD